MSNGLIVQEQVISGPRFPVGMPVKFDGYFGVSEADEPRPDNARILSVRLAADVDDEWVSTGPGTDDGYYRDSITYPKGWEYLLVRLRQPSKECGWVRERELIDNGYEPPVRELADPPLTARISGPHVSDLAGLDDETVDLGSDPHATAPATDARTLDVRGTV
jgi:hypothetical protein